MRPRYELLPYRAGDERALCLSGDMAKAYAEAGGRIPKGPCYSLSRGGQVIAIAGVAGFDSDAPTLWGLCGAMTPRDWLCAAHHILAYLRAVWGAQNRPLWLITPPGDRRAAGYAQKLGFEFSEIDGEMRWTRPHF